MVGQSFHQIQDHILYRSSLLQEIKATKEDLVSSLNNVQALECEAKKVPGLKAKIAMLESILLCQG